MQSQCFPGMHPWGRDQIESQLSIFPEGQLVVEIDGKLAASSSSLILENDPSLEWHNWRAVVRAWWRGGLPRPPAAQRAHAGCGSRRTGHTCVRARM